MKNKMKKSDFLLYNVAVSSIIFLVTTLLSSTKKLSNECSDLFYIERGFPFKFISCTKQNTLVQYQYFLFDYLLVLGIVLLAMLVFVKINDLSRKRMIKRIGVVVTAGLLLFSRGQWINATTVKVNNWRLMKDGKLYYSVPQKYESYVNNARNIWNGYKKNAIKQRTTSVDVVFYEANLGTGINGVTYSNGMIYFNTVTWLGQSRFSLEEKEKKNCAAHEMGHALGLAENKSNTKNVMYPDTSKNCTLTADDKASYETAFALSFKH